MQYINSFTRFGCRSSYSVMLSVIIVTFTHMAYLVKVINGLHFSTLFDAYYCYNYSLIPKNY